MLLLNYLHILRKKHKRFFAFVIGLFGLYGLQFVFKCEITPLGYFSLYSNPTPAASSYYQILPINSGDSLPLNIYQASGSGFLMMEILPQRYKILSESVNCNQMHEKLKALGFSSGDGSDCVELKKFNTWFPVYAHRLELQLNPNYALVNLGFFRGAIRDSIKVKGSE